MPNYTKEDHIAWMKKRAIELVQANNLVGALNSISSDLQKHPQTIGHPAVELGTQLYISGNLETPEKMIKFIEDIK
jgi:hypothetical protein